MGTAGRAAPYKTPNVPRIIELPGRLTRARTTAGSSTTAGRVEVEALLWERITRKTCLVRPSFYL